MVNFKKLGIVIALGLGTYLATNYWLQDDYQNSSEGIDDRVDFLADQAAIIQDAGATRREAVEAQRLAEEQERRRREEEVRQQQEIKTFAIAEDEHERVVRTAYECGRNIAYDVDDWEYVEPRDEYKIDLSLTWEGCVSGGFYEANGTLRQEGVEISWHPDWHNERLETYVKRRDFTKIAVGAAVVIGVAVSNKNRNETNQ